MPKGRPTIATADGRMSFAIGGLWQLRHGRVLPEPLPTTQFPQLPTGVNLRRGRLYFIGKFDDLRVNVAPDFAGSPDGNPTLFEANINYTGIKPLTFTVGYTRPVSSLEDSTFPGNLLFLERANIINIERDVAAGIQRGSLGGNAATEDYWLSAYLTGPVYGARKILSATTSSWRLSAGGGAALSSPRLEPPCGGLRPARVSSECQCER